MTTALPHSSIIQNQLDNYLDDIEIQVSGCSTRWNRSNEYRGIFKNSLSTFTVLLSLSRGQQVPFIRVASDVARRLPLLVAFQQITSEEMSESMRFLAHVHHAPKALKTFCFWPRYDLERREP